MEIKQLYDATRQGLDIILDCVNIPEECVGNKNKKFKLRDERTASAVLYKPTEKCQHWHIVDYGERQMPLSPIDIYMRTRGYGQGDFALALNELAEKYGVVDALDRKTNRPEWNERALREGEKPVTYVELLDNLLDACIARVWGNDVKADHLKALGWHQVKTIVYAKEDKVKECHATDTYPIYAQRCNYFDAEGEGHEFMKVYQPFAFDKSMRFMYIGHPPRDFIYGLDALVKAYHANDDKKLECVVIVSGGSDAANCLAMGYHPVWLTSETDELTATQYKRLKEYANVVYNIPDADATGIEQGRRLALQYIDIRTAWLPEKTLGRFHDNRGRRTKDLKDYLRLRPGEHNFKHLLEGAHSARFWYWVEGKDGKRHMEISLSDVCYFLWLNGFATLRDERSKETCYVRIDGNVVERVTLKDIHHFLRNWIEENVRDNMLLDKLMRSNDIQDRLLGNSLKEVSLDFTRGDADSQWFYMRNKAVRVTAEGIESFDYKSLNDSGRYVWKEDIIPHDYVKTEPMFNITRREDGTYAIDILSNKSEMMDFFINASRMYWRKELEERFGDNLDEAAEYHRSHRFCINGEGLTEEEIADQMQSLVNKMFLLGYLMHSYKVQSRAWAGMLFDYRLSENDECNGRSGKSLFGKLMRHYIRMVCLEAKDRRITERQFVFANVTESTDVVFVDECHRNLDYYYFFGRVTDDFSVERKGIDPYTIPFAKSPKMLIATNYVVPNQDSSTTARQLPAVFSDYYHQTAPNNDYRENRSVRDDFGHDLADEAYKGWNDDIAFILQCEQFYLSVIGNGEKILPPMQNIQLRQQRQKIGSRFEAWAADFFAEDSGNLDVILKEDDVFNDYSQEQGRESLNRTKFRKKLREYCLFANHIACLNPMDITSLKEDGAHWRKHETSKHVTYLYVRSTKAAQELTATQQPTQQTMDFDDYIPDLETLKAIGDSDEPF